MFSYSVFIASIIFSCSFNKYFYCIWLMLSIFILKYSRPASQNQNDRWNNQWLLERWTFLNRNLFNCFCLLKSNSFNWLCIRRWKWKGLVWIKFCSIVSAFSKKIPSFDNVPVDENENDLVQAEICSTVLFFQKKYSQLILYSSMKAKMTCVN